jgi:hypothetical protein
MKWVAEYFETRESLSPTRTVVFSASTQDEAAKIAAQGIATSEMRVDDATVTKFTTIHKPIK